MIGTAAVPELPQLRSRSSWPRRALLLLVFVSGGIVGAAGGSYWTRERVIAMMQHPEQIPDRILPRIQAELCLSDDQSRKVEEIVRRRHAAMEAQRAESYPRQLAEFHGMRAEIAEILEPTQHDKWSALCDAVERRYLPIRPAGPPPADALFGRFDVDQDGALAADEVPAGMWRRLRLADEDGDGQVTRAEFLAAAVKAKAE